MPTGRARGCPTFTTGRPMLQRKADRFIRASAALLSEGFEVEFEVT